MIEELHQMLAFAGPDAIREIFLLYLADVPKRVEALERARDAGDSVGLERAAHGLRGSSVSVGANRLAELCRALEEDTSEALPKVDAILREASWVVRLVEAEIEQLDRRRTLASTG